MHTIKWDKRAEHRRPAQLYSQSRTIKKNQSISKAASPPITWSCVTNKGQIILVNLFLRALFLRQCIPAHTGSAPAAWRSRCRERWPSPCTAAAPGRPCSSVTADRTEDTGHEKTKKNPMTAVSHKKQKYSYKWGLIYKYSPNKSANLFDCTFVWCQSDLWQFESHIKVMLLR